MPRRRRGRRSTPEGRARWAAIKRLRDQGERARIAAQPTAFPLQRRRGPYVAPTRSGLNGGRWGAIAPNPRGLANYYGRGTPQLVAGGLIEFSWTGRKVLDITDAAVVQALATVAEQAEDYWRNVVWAPGRHRYMTGTERDHGYFRVEVTGQHRARLVAGVNLDAEYPLYVEFGTSRMAAQYPLRSTVDFIAPRIAREVRRQIALAQGTGG